MVGRPAVKIDDLMIQEAQAFASQGLTMEQIADAMGMSERTLYEKQARFSQFSQAIKKGRAQGIQEVANVVFEKAKGGDITAAIFYLKCRAGWNDKAAQGEMNAQSEPPGFNVSKDNEQY